MSVSNVMDVGALIVVDVVQIRVKCPAKSARISPKPIAGNASQKVRRDTVHAVALIVGTTAAADMPSTVLAVIPYCAKIVKRGMAMTAKKWKKMKMRKRRKMRKTPLEWQNKSFFLRTILFSATLRSVQEVSLLGFLNSPGIEQREKEHESA